MFKKRNNNNPFLIQEGRFKDGQLNDFSYRKSWTENSFISDNKGAEIVGKIFSKDNFSYKFLIFIISFFMLILIAKVAWLQIIKGEYYHGLAEGNRIKIEREEAKRGVIYDRNMNPLVRNIANFLLYLIPIDLPKNKEEKIKIIKRISSILSKDDNYDEIFQSIINKIDKIKIKSLESYQPLFLKDNIDYESAMSIYLEVDNMQGVILTNKSIREYNLHGLSLSHILGYTGKINEEELKIFGDDYLSIDYIGKSGIEYFWENELRGLSGKKYIEVDALGRKRKIINVFSAENGNDLILSLDAVVQKKLEDIILLSLQELNLSKAIGIILNPNNGEILASVSIPSYDNNFFARGISQKEYNKLIDDSDNPLFNRAIRGEYPSGSVFKPIVAVASLQEGIISKHTTFNSTGGIRIGQWFFPDWKAGGHGITNVKKAIAESVNTFFYYIGGGYDDFRGLGVDRIFNYAKLFGLGSQTGVDLPGEKDGFLPSKEWKKKNGERWYIGNTYHFAIGQGDILVTPLQVANYTATFANKGSLYRPHFVRSISNGTKKTIKNIETIPVKSNFIDKNNIEIIRESMRATVTNGSAINLNSLLVSSAGKTGTAQWSTKKETHAWFTGFAPYENAEIVITILVEEGGEGSSVAVPIAKEFLEWYFGEYKVK